MNRINVHTNEEWRQRYDEIFELHGPPVECRLGLVEVQAEAYGLVSVFIQGSTLWEGVLLIEWHAIGYAAEPGAIVDLRKHAKAVLALHWRVARDLRIHLKGGVV